MAIPTRFGMELHTSCDSDVEMGNRKGQGNMLPLSPVTIAALATSSEFKYRLIRRRNLSIAWGHACLPVPSGLSAVYGSGQSVAW